MKMNKSKTSEPIKAGDIVVITDNNNMENDKWVVYQYHDFKVGSIGEVLFFSEDEDEVMVLGLSEDGFVATQYIYTDHLEKLGSIYE